MIWDRNVDTLPSHIVHLSEGSSPGLLTVDTWQKVEKFTSGKLLELQSSGKGLRYGKKEKSGKSGIISKFNITLLLFYERKK